MFCKSMLQPLGYGILLGLLGLCSGQCQNGNCDDSQLLQVKVDSQIAMQTEASYEPQDIKGKSIYFVLAGFFADPPPEQNMSASCDGPEWCNGTIKGITNKLDYIQGMGFEGIWLSPVLKNFYGPDPDGRSGYGAYGYWAYNWYEIDEHFGTAEDLKELSSELHKRGMVFIYDIVLNHCGPVHSMADVEQIVPFNKPEYFHQRGIGNLTFDEYTQGFAYGGKGYPPPVQGLGGGAMCKPGLPNGCSTYVCPVDAGFGNPCPTEPSYLGDEAPGPADIPNCGVGDLVCEGYNADQTVEGWFYDLADLNHSHPFVHDEMIKWGKYMKDTYQIDAFRLDTAPYVAKDFLADFQEAVGIPILGEVTASNRSFFEAYAPRGKKVLDGLLNFYLQNVATPAFCGIPAFFPGANLNLTSLGYNTELQLSSKDLNDLDLLGNFIDNHDMARLADYCTSNMPRMKNALAWVMLARGIPIIYYGTEDFLTSRHPAKWQSGYETDTMGYQFLTKLNEARQTAQIGVAGMKVEAADETHLVFSRGEHVTVFLNNLDEGGPVEYDATSLGSCSKWLNLLDPSTGIEVKDGKLTTDSHDPLVIVCQ